MISNEINQTNPPQIISLWQDEDDSKLKSKLKSNEASLTRKRLKSIKGNIQSKYEEVFNSFSASYSKKFSWANDSTQIQTKEVSPLESLLQSSKMIVQTKEDKENHMQIKVKNSNYKQKIVYGYVQDRDLTLENKHNSIVSNIKFHPTSNDICISTGLDRTMKVFQVNNKQSLGSNQSYSSKLLSHVEVKDMPIYSAEFLNKSQNEILLSGRRKHFFSFSFEENKLSKHVLNLSMIRLNTEIQSLERCFSRINSDSFSFSTLEGDILIFDSKSKLYKSSLKINGSVTSVIMNTFSSNYIVSSSNHGEIYVFDIRNSNKCLNKFDDQGSINTLSMDIDNDEEYLASSQHTGYVNLYRLKDILQSSLGNQGNEVKPLKTFENLTTSIDNVRFSNKGRLAFTSKWLKGGVKIVDLKKMRYEDVLINRINVKFPFCCDFSYDDEMFVVGNDEGRGVVFRYSE